MRLTTSLPSVAHVKINTYARTDRSVPEVGFHGLWRPAAHIALMKDEVVTRRHCLTDAEFLDLLGAANLIPGPNSTQMAIHIGYRRAGWSGLIAAGVSFHPGSVSDRAPDTKTTFMPLLGCLAKTGGPKQLRRNRNRTQMPAL
jgi:hypothetical protein